MNDFVMTYGLWLVIALLVLIVVIYLLSGRKGREDVDTPSSAEAPKLPREFNAAPTSPPAPAIMTPPIADPIAPLATIDPMPVTAPPLPEAVIADAFVPTGAVPIVPAAVPSSSGADNLLLLKGVGPKLAAMLGELGVTSFAQIAAWTDSDLAAVDARLGNFKGRPVRDHWVDQAKYLAAGDVAGFEAKYGKL